MRGLQVDEVFGPSLFASTVCGQKREGGKKKKKNNSPIVFGIIIDDRNVEKHSNQQLKQHDL